MMGLVGGSSPVDAIGAAMDHPEYREARRKEIMWRMQEGDRALRVNALTAAMSLSSGNAQQLVDDAEAIFAFLKGSDVSVVGASAVDMTAAGDVLNGKETNDG